MGTRLGRDLWTVTDAADVADAPASGRAAVLLFALVPILAIVGAISIRALGVLESSDTIVARLIPHLDVARAAARSENVPLTLLLAVASAESAGRVDAVSPRGAVGLMQLMEPTAAELAAEQGVTLPDRTDPGTSLQLGARYLGRQITRFADDPRGPRACVVRLQRRAASRQRMDGPAGSAS